MQPVSSSEIQSCGAVCNTPSHDEWIPEEDLHAPDLLVEFHLPPSSIRTLQLDDKSPCSLLPTTSIHRDQSSPLASTTMSNNLTASPSTPESTRPATPSLTTQPSSNQENIPPPSLTPFALSNLITHLNAGVQSPCISIDNLSTSSASPLPIRPPSLAAPLLSIPTVTTTTSS